MKTLDNGVRIFTGLIALSALTGCVAVVGTPEGVRAYGDLQQGLVSEAKASADTTSSAQVTRRVIEREKTKRHLKPSILTGLFSKGS